MDNSDKRPSRILGLSGRVIFREGDFTGVGTQMMRCGVLLSVSLNVKAGGLRYLVSPLGERVTLATRFEEPIRELGS
jgi:hypothetical protein